MLVVCHDLTDFRFRIEVEKDRQVAAKLQHEDKNTHKAQEVGANFAIEQLGIIEAQLVAQRDAAERFESPELRQIWMDLAAVREHSFAAIKQATGTLRTLEQRSQRAQEESHTRIMMYQLVADECVVPTPQHPPCNPPYGMTLPGSPTPSQMEPPHVHPPHTDSLLP